MRVVFDANVIAAAIVFRGEASALLLKLARRRLFAFGTTETLEETRDVVTELARERGAKHNVGGALAWYLEKTRLVEPAPLGKRRSRDVKDDPYLAAALSAQADFIVTYDKDLLVLGKPFGVAIMRPMVLLKIFTA